MTTGAFIWEERSYNKYKAGCLAAELGISPLVTGILLERGMTDAESMRNFLYGSTKPYHDPFLLKGMVKSVARIEQALEAGEKITVYGDYDVDGITASSLLVLYLKSRGARVDSYIPKREGEGYGLNDEAIRTIADSGTTLMVTVDCGISGINEVLKAPEGLDIIITDHHNVPEEVPPAYAVIDAKQEGCQYPFKDLSGVGIAFKLCQALEQKVPGCEPKWQELTELVALGTVADIVPLVGENREIVRRGLKAMETTRLVGLKELIKICSLDGKNISSENIGFGLAPRLNAVGRLEHAESAVELLTTEDIELAEAIAIRMNDENKLRQEISNSIMEEAEAMLRAERHIDTAIVLACEGWHQGVIGIVASRLVDKYHLPTILISLSGAMGKGSCRSIPALDLYQAIAAQKDVLTQFGGHHQAAGLTLPSKNVDAFRSRFKEYVAKTLKPQDYLPVQVIDCVLPDNQEITLQDLQELSLLEPCGCSNSTPLFAFKQALVNEVRSMGKDGKHLQLRLAKGNGSYRCVMWNGASMMPYLFGGMLADVVFFPKVNTWQGRSNVQLEVKGIRQDCAVGDFRGIRGREGKLASLKMLARTSDKFTVCVNSIPQDLATDETLAGHACYCTYEDLKGMSCQLEDMVVFWDLPGTPLDKVLRFARQKGATCINLLFNASDFEQARAHLALSHPCRSDLVAAYKNMQTYLKWRKSANMEKLLDDNSGTVSENAIKIFVELGFVRSGNGIISWNAGAGRNDLDNSLLYLELSGKRQQLEEIYKANMSLSQYALLRS